MSNNELTTSRRNMIVLVMLLSAFVAMLNATILNTALPDISKSMEIEATTSQWLITGFMLVNGIMIPLTAFLMEKYTTRFLYTFSMVTFVLGSIIAVCASNFEFLLLARVFQAVGAGILLPLMQFTIFIMFPVEKRGFAMGLTGIVAQSAPAIGPTLSGLLLDNYSWRMPFFVVALFSLIIFILGVRVVKSNDDKKPLKLDKLSVVYSTLGFGFLLFSFSSIGTLGLTSPSVLITFILGVFVVTIFVFRQLHLKNPLLNVRVFRNSTFTLSSIASMIIFIGIVGPALLIPMYIQLGLGLSALLSGLVILPGAVFNAFISVYTGKVFDKFGGRILIIPGFILLIIMTILHSFLTTSTPYWYVVTIYAIRMFSVGLLMMPLNTIAINALPNTDISHGTAIMNSVRIIAGAMGTALSITVMSIITKASAQIFDIHGSKLSIMKQSIVYGIDAAFIFTTFLIIIAFILSLFIKEKHN
ncbi:MDR family MFS transporter [Staphylococcus caprae]|uniref:MDR family MFS transporter n=1 Tax=Staphylococcus caprae TaxID=29380 RepID=UPI001C83A08E|nr:MDR family MFS transporter [Staphylococcus caprae]MBX5317020.1 multidrug efflux MFS transporter [Staphylococcus caprae]MBX5320300.1 multidrug efflux MFS transporter [Staphylococcus caprae]MBX5324325.1 multidrug efflux MFS transporter [Staphylococcus caprae]MDI9232104.1 MDR family MFS transporter [Staphylococcus caprae]MEB8095866.1 DHA2 family efflux MFS transporter permease subunit [Staphylococcus caprae]